MRRIWAMLVCALLPFAGGSVWALDPPATDNDIVYRLTDEFYMQLHDTVTVDFVIVQRDNDSITRIDVKFYWNSSKFRYLTSRRGNGWPDTTKAFSPTVNDTSLSFNRDSINFKFDSTKAVIQVDFFVDCVSFSDTTESVEFEFDSQARPFENYFHRVSTPYYPGTLENSTIEFDGVFFGDGLTVIETPGHKDIEIGDTFKVEVVIEAAFDPWGGVKTAFKWTNRLDFVRVDTAGTLFSGLTFLDSVFAGDSLWVHTSDSFDVPGAQTLFYLVFVSTATTENIKDTILNKWDSVFSGCTYLKDGDIGAEYPYEVIIPRYSATIDIVDRSMGRSATQPVTVKLQHNFTVDMQADDIDECAAFHIDTTNWTLVSWANNFSTSYTDGNRVYRWEQMQDTGSSTTYRDILREDPDYSSNDVLKSPTSYHNIATYDVTSGTSTGAQTVKFRRIKDALGEGQDSKLKSYNSSIVVYSFADTTDDIDSLFYLETGTVTVSGGGGGGSCPFAMTWDGTRFVDENTILTQSENTAAGVPVVDYYPLGHTPAAYDGTYRLRIEEREQETSYLDEVKLLVLDVKPGEDVSVTPDGRFFYTSKKVAPVKAFDYRGYDVLAQVSKPDKDVYLSDGAGWLVVTYEPTESQSGRVFVGHAVPAKADPCDPDDADSSGNGKMAFGGDVRDPGERLEPSILGVSYRQGAGVWTKLPDGPPRIYDASTFSLTDLALVVGETVEVKYEWSRSWTADELTLVTASDRVPRPVEFSPQAAFSEVSGNATELIAKADNEFMVLNQGESVELRFPAGRRALSDQNAYFVIAAKGYYTPYAQDNDLTLPVSFALHPNYPNPFNAQTRIEFALPVETHVDLEIFNVLGQKVKTLVSGTFPAGNRSVIWDGTNDDGALVASGTYFMRMKADAFEERRKMTLLK